MAKMLLESREFSKKKKKKCINMTQGGKLPWRSIYSKEMCLADCMFSVEIEFPGDWHVECDLATSQQPSPPQPSLLTFFIVVNRIELGKRCHDNRWR